MLAVFFLSFFLKKFEVGLCAYYRALLTLDGMKKNVSTGGCLAYSITAKVNLACSSSCRDIRKLSHHDSPTFWVHSRNKMVHYSHPHLVYKFREGFIPCCFSSSSWWLDFTNRLPFGLHTISSTSLSTCMHHKAVRTMNYYTVIQQPLNDDGLDLPRFSSPRVSSWATIKICSENYWHYAVYLVQQQSWKHVCGRRAGPLNEWLRKPH